MSLTNKTTNDYFGIGTNEDIFSLFDFNANFEKADELINELKTNETKHEAKINELENILNNIKTNVDNILITTSNLTQNTAKNTESINTLANASKETSTAITNINMEITRKQGTCVAELYTAQFTTNWTVVKKENHLLVGAYTARTDNSYGISSINKSSNDFEYIITINGVNGGNVALYLLWLPY